MSLLSNIDDSIVFSSSNPIENITKISGFVEKIEGNGKLKKEFRWSIDGINYSSWISLTDDNLQKIVLKSPTLYFKAKYTLEAVPQTNVISFDLQYETSIRPEVETNIPHLHPMIQKELTNSMGIQITDDFTYNFYDNNKGKDLQSRLSQMSNNLFGHECIYYRAVPSTDSEDIVLKEYTMYDEKDGICFKILVPDNEFPEDKPNFINIMGIDIEASFEIHINIRYFESVFGKGEMPQKFDRLFIPILDRYYEISSSYVHRDFMNHPIYFVVNLIKWQPKSAVKSTEGSLIDIENTTKSIEDLFKPLRTDEIDRNINDEQNEIKTVYYDPGQYTRNENMIYSNNIIKIGDNTLSETQYDLQNNYLNNSSEIAVEYTKSDITFKENENMSFLCWFNPYFNISNKISNVVGIKQQFDPIFTMQTERDKNMMNYKVGSEFELNSNSINLLGSITSVENPKMFTVMLDNRLYDNTSWVTNTFTTNLTNKITFITNNSENKGISIELFKEKIFLIKLNDILYKIELDFDLENKWYGLSVNISNTFQQLNVRLYQIELGEQLPVLIYDKLITNIGCYDYTSDSTFKLMYSPVQITNIRLYRETIQKENEARIIGQQYIEDGHYALIVDNATDKLPNSYLGNTI